MVWTFKVGTLINAGCSVDVGETILEKDRFLVGETIHARYDTARTENTPYPSWMRWFRLNTTTNQWDLIYEYYPDRAYGCGVTSWIFPPLTDIAGKYFVGYGVPDTPDWKASKTIYIDAVPIPALSSAYFVKNGVADFDCQVTTSDNISFTASATGLILGQRYKCEWKTRKDSEITESSFFSNLVTASLLTTFNSIWNAPVTVAGNYTISYVVIYDELNIPVWSGAPP